MENGKSVSYSILYISPWVTLCGIIFPLFIMLPRKKKVCVGLFLAELITESSYISKLSTSTDGAILVNVKKAAKEDWVFFCLFVCQRVQSMMQCGYFRLHDEVEKDGDEKIYRHSCLHSQQMESLKDAGAVVDVDSHGEEDEYSRVSITVPGFIMWGGSGCKNMMVWWCSGKWVKTWRVVVAGGGGRLSRGEQKSG